MITMKKAIIMLAIFSGTLASPTRTDAQITDIVGIVTSAVKKVITALDLEVQKLQEQTLVLQDAQKQVENLMHQSNLDAITGWVQQEKDLFSEYYNELWTIKQAISTYEKVREIVVKQEQIISDYNKAYSLIKQDPHFSPNEISHIYAVYGGILNQSIDNINQLTRVLTSFLTQMDDSHRLKMIDEVGERVDQNYSDLHRYTQENIMLSMERAHDENDAAEIMALYGIED
jgi:hypothetical protein